MVGGSGQNRIRPRLWKTFGVGLLAATIAHAGDIESDGKLVSTAGSGPPLEVSSSERVDGLNADLLDGLEATDLYTRTEVEAIVADALLEHRRREHPKIVFAMLPEDSQTGTFLRGALGGLAGADDLCQAEARGTLLRGTFRAWLSDATTSAADRLTHADVPYELVGGTQIADDWNDLTDGTLDNPIDRTAAGEAIETDPSVTIVDVWTDTTASGLVIDPGAECQGWTSGSAGDAGAVGQLGKTDAAWTDTRNTLTCDATAWLYCLQQ